MSWDPNWLLSTTAQSAAALVAIVAGFLVSRVLSLASERSYLSQRLQEARNDLEPKRERIKELEAWIIDVDAGDFLDQALNDLVKSEGNIPLRNLIQKHGSQGLTEEELQPYYDRTVETVKRAYELMGPLSEDELDSLDPQAWLAAHGSYTPEEENIYHKVHEYLQDRHRQIYESHAYLSLLTRSTMPDVSLPRSANQYYVNASRELGELRVEAEQLELQESDLLQRFQRIEIPPGVWKGVGVLAFFAAAGVLCPIALLATGPTELQPAMRWTVFGLFTAGLVSLMVYLVWSIRELSR